MSFGRLGVTRPMVFRSRRCFVSTSQIGSPLTPSATGAQPATLYVFPASMGRPPRRMSLMRCPIAFVGVQV